MHKPHSGSPAMDEATAPGESPGLPEAFLPPPPRTPFYLRLGIWIAERTTGKVMMPARLLAWYPRAALGSGLLESLVAHDEPGMNPRMLQIIRMAASNEIRCRFCIDLNTHGRRLQGITDEEADMLRTGADPASVATLSERERLAIVYARLISQTPVKFHPDTVSRVRAAFTEREFIILTTTAAQVNYWARLIPSLGIPPAGFGE